LSFSKAKCVSSHFTQSCETGGDDKHGCNVEIPNFAITSVQVFYALLLAIYLGSENICSNLGDCSQDLLQYEEEMRKESLADEEKKKHPLMLRITNSLLSLLLQIFTMG